MGHISQAQASFTVLQEHSAWSAAIYGYTRAATTYQLLADTAGPRDEAAFQKVIDLMAAVPNDLQRVAGKSIPIEKWVARKSKRFASRGHHLTLPAMEACYFFNAFVFAPLFVLRDNHLVAIDRELEKLSAVPEAERPTWSDNAYYDGEFEQSSEMLLTDLLRQTFACCMCVKSKATSCVELTACWSTAIASSVLEIASFPRRAHKAEAEGRLQV